MKLCLGFAETITFRHSITVEAESIDALNEICERIERHGAPEDLDDYVSRLEARGIEVLDRTVDDSGSANDFECDDIYAAADGEGAQS